MRPFWVSEVVERHGEQILYINPLPEKYCTFDCVFCPIEQRTIKKTEDSFTFKETASFMHEVEQILKKSKVDKLFILPDGEGLANRDIKAIIDLGKSYGCKIKIITNGYVLNKHEYKEVLKDCDEVIGELMTTNEIDFQRLQRPIKGYTLEAYVNNLADFRKDFKGAFNLSITLLKNHSDNDKSLEFFKEAVKLIKPNHVYIETPDEGKLQQAFGVDEAVIERFQAELNNR